MRDIQNHKEDVDLLSLGFSSFFLNRTNRSGILKAGVIGGYQQTGNYKIDARYRKEISYLVFDALLLMPIV